VSRYRDIALVVALAAVGIAALVGPLLRGSAAPLVSGTGGGQSPARTPQPSPTALVGQLGISAAGVVATTTPDGTTVLSVRLTARLRSTEALMLRLDEAGPAVRFTIVAPQSRAVVGLPHVTPPVTIPSGATVAVDLTFDLRGLSLAPTSASDVAAGAPAAPGTWLLTVDLVDVTGMRHHAETPVTIVPRA